MDITFNGTINGTATQGTATITLTTADLPTFNISIPEPPAPTLPSPINPQYLPPNNIILFEGAVLALGPNGEVWKDAVLMPGIFVKRLCVYGRSIFGLGKTTPIWWRYTGTAWVQVPAGFDARILNDDAPTTAA